VAFMPAKKAKKHDLCGLYNYRERAITLAPNMAPVSQWATLWHEIVHVALMDAGAHGNALTKDQEEIVCDAIGAHLTGMMLDGALRLISPGTRQAPMA
jgi:hypothetical protein